MVWDSLPAHISRPLQSVIKMATAADEAERYASMAHFFVALNNVCGKQHNWRIARAVRPGKAGPKGVRGAIVS